MVLEKDQAEKLNNLIPIGYSKQTLKKSRAVDFKENLDTFWVSLNNRHRSDEASDETLITNFLSDILLKKGLFSMDLSEYEINRLGRIDRALFRKKDKSPQLIFEIKTETNKGEMITLSDFKKKALYELISYFWQEENSGNHEIKYLIVTNGFEWFIFNSQDFKKITSKYEKVHSAYFKDKSYSSTNTEGFYTIVSEENDSFFTSLQEVVYYFNLKDYISKDISNSEQAQDLIKLYRIFTPYVLLKYPHTTDANTLSPDFYHELLYILGLEENKKERTIVETTTQNTFIKLIAKAKPGLTIFEDKLKYILLIINRVLFLKLLEATLIAFNPDKPQYRFLTKNNISDFGRLRELFFDILASKNRTNVLDIFKDIPYLNSSLFEKTDDEDFLYQISMGDLMAVQGEDHKKLPPLHYLLDFLGGYDFGSNDSILQDEAKPLINSAVLGLVFEKINGYKEGAHFTPEMITSYMSDTAIKQALINLFSEELKETINTWDELKTLILSRKEKGLEAVFNKIRICDPAVGSGHFIVSALNKLIELKHDLGLLCYKDKTVIHRQDYTIKTLNDELIIFDHKNRLFQYEVSQGKIHPEKQKLQEAIFEEKRTLIENCLFGVDINPKSVMICRLRLWIELLKYTYYHIDNQNSPLELETLPNIDINIKEGNSLISRFAIKDAPALSSEYMDFLTHYKKLVTQYKEVAAGSRKKQFRKDMELLKLQFQFKLISPKIQTLSQEIDAKKVTIDALHSQEGIGGASSEIKSLLPKMKNALEPCKKRSSRCSATENTLKTILKPWEKA